MGLRTTQAVLSLLGIGVLAWLTAISFSGPYGYTNPYVGWFDYFFLPFALVILSLSFNWCAICVLVPLLRKTHRPVHPGTAVGFDLILWLALVVTALFTIAAIYDLQSFGRGGTIEDYNYSSSGDYSGHYKLLSNGTWVYKITYNGYSNGGGYHYNYTTGNYTYSNPPSHVNRICTPEFASCAAQDASVNKLWQEQDARFGTEIVAAIVQWIGVGVHFALFVWACVDVHRRNRGVKDKEMQGVAESLIRDMQARGIITVNDPLLAERVGQGRGMEERQAEMRGGAERGPGNGGSRRQMEEVPGLGVAGPSNRGVQREGG